MQIQTLNDIYFLTSTIDRPAAMRRWGWHRLYGRVPILPGDTPEEVHARIQVA